MLMKSCLSIIIFITVTPDLQADLSEHARPPLQRKCSSGLLSVKQACFKPTNQLSISLLKPRPRSFQQNQNFLSV
ncbi:hypothetical protein LDENG_00241190 [Lucifuga dentata]|nr:hypothetical protein LDENG_00241190 [Lucifuga dentata]